MRSKTSGYTEEEFLEFVKDIHANNEEKFPTEESHIQAVLKFRKLTEHPSDSDLLYYPNENREDSPAGVVKEVKEWHASRGPPGFKTGWLAINKPRFDEACSMLTLLYLDSLS